MPAKLIKTRYPVPSNKNGHEFTSAEQLLSVLGKSEGETARTFSLVTLGRDVGKIKKGDRVLGSIQFLTCP